MTTIQVGDNVVYTTPINPATGKSEYIPGMIVAINGDVGLLRQGETELKVSLEYCTKVFDCLVCKDEGGYAIPAHQEAGRIVDEAWVSCECTKRKYHE